MTVGIIWLLLVQGSGGSSSAINTVHRYPDERTCLQDAHKLEKAFWAHTLCLPVKQAEQEKRG